MSVALDAARPLARLLNRRQAPSEDAPVEGPAAQRAFLYDAQGTDRGVTLEAVDVTRLTDRQLLWVDVSDPGELPSLAAAFDLADETVEAVLEPVVDPTALIFDHYVHVAVMTPGGVTTDEALALHCLVGSNWIVTVHRSAVDFHERFDERIRTDSNLGRIDSQSFLVAILQEHVATYLAELRPIEAELDEIDVRSISGRIDEEHLLRELVRNRIQLTRLRRLLEPHRDLYARLGRSEFAVLSGSDSVAEFETVGELVERALASMESTREMIAGSFEIYTTWAAQRTNLLMKRLTIASVTLLPPTLLAGIMGMNALPQPLMTTTAFLLSSFAIFGLALGTVTLAWARGWF